MKGIFVGTVLLIAILTLTTTGILLVIFYSESINLKTSLKSSEVLKYLDFVEAVKRGLDYSYNYSFYQIAYELGKRGGYEDEESISEWRRYKNTNFPYSYISSLENGTEEYIREYLEALESLERNFSFPYPKVKITLIGENRLENVKMFVTFPNLFNFSKHFFIIYDNPNRTIYLPLDYFKLYNISYQLFIIRDIINETIEETENKISKECSYWAKNVCTDGRICSLISGEVCESELYDEETTLKRVCPNADENFNNSVVKEIENIKVEDPSIDLNIKVLNITVKHTYSRSLKIIGCCEWVCSEDGTCTCVDLLYDVKYYYYYYAAVKAGVNFTTRNKYPVYDSLEGSTKFRKFALLFNLTSSNDYEWTPI